MKKGLSLRVLPFFNFNEPTIEPIGFSDQFVEWLCKGYSKRGSQRIEPTNRAIFVFLHITTILNFYGNHRSL